MSIPSPRRRPLTAAISTTLLAAALLPGVTLAQTAKEQELEARVQQLEQQIQQLLGQQREQQSAISQTQSQLDQVRTTQAAAPATVPAGQQPIQSTSILPGAPAGSRFTLGGMIRTDAMLTKTSDGDIAKNNAGRDFYVPGAIPVSTATSTTGPDPYFDAHAKFSRLWFDASTTLNGGGKLGARVEVDFFGGALGNSAATNTYGTIVRHAYLTYNNWTIGQTWSNFMDTGALIDAVDFVGPTDAVVFVRQSQVRYSTGGWSFSLENPETTVLPLGGGTRIIAGDNTYPDLTVRYTHRGDWGHVSVGGLLRQLKYEPIAGQGQSETGFGANISGLFKIGASTDFRYQVTAGEGIGRYIGLATVHQDSYIKPTSGGGFELEALGGWAAYAGLRHVISPGLRGNLYYATSHWDNDTLYTGLGAAKKVQSWHANLIWSPVPKLDFGVEAIWGERTFESGHDGELLRLHTMARYSF